MSTAVCPKINAAAAQKGETGYLVVPDRREAIRLAVALARPGEAVLVAGKGHENYQIWGAERRHFDDREEVAEALDREISSSFPSCAWERNLTAKLSLASIAIPKCNLGTRLIRNLSFPSPGGRG